MTGAVRRLAGSSLGHMAGAFLAMGGWALFANRDHGLSRMLTAGAVQGMLSALITLFLKSMIERLARNLEGAAALFAPPAVAIAVSATLLLVVHLLARTPELAGTIALPLLVSTGYAALYSYSLYRKEQRTP